MERITKQDLQVALARLRVEMHEPCLELVRWAPGDGMVRYRIEVEGVEPLGSRFWLGASNAYQGMWTAIYAMEWARGVGRGQALLKQRRALS